MCAFRYFLVIPLLALAVLTLPAGRAAAEPAHYNAADEARNAARALGLQTELPGAAPKSESGKTIKPENLPDTDSSFKDIFSWNLKNISTGLLVIATIVILGIVIMNLRSNLWSNSRARQLTPEEQEELAPEATAARMDKAQLAADDFALSGDYAEAMHVLLLQSVNELRLRLDVTIAVSLTSREIAQRIRLSETGRKVFSEIVSKVEICYFGAHAPGEEDYLACRRSYEALTLALRDEVSRLNKSLLAGAAS